MSSYTFEPNEYNKIINKKHHLPLLVILILLTLFFSVAYFLQPKKTNIIEYHIVNAGSFETYKDALILASSIKQVGGAGYVYFDSSYHVLVCHYNNYNDAQQVIKNISNSYPESKVLTISINRYNKSANYSKRQNEDIETLFTNIEKIIYSLSSYNVQLDSNELSPKQVKINISNFLSKYTEFFDSFIDSCRNESKLNTAKKHAENIKKSLVSLSSCTETDLNQIIKFETINIIVNYSSLRSAV